MSKVPSSLLEELWLHHCPLLTHEINCFSIHEFMKQFWRHQTCKFYKNITNSLVFMMVFRIDGNFFIVLPIRLETCRLNRFFFFTTWSVRTFYRKVSQMFCGPERARSASGVQFVKAWIGYSGEAKDHIKLFLTKIKHSTKWCFLQTFMQWTSARTHLHIQLKKSLKKPWKN